jgi:hypothetical protein
MLQAIAECVIDYGLQGVGWAVLKMVTFGRYRGFRTQDLLVEGSVGVLTLAGITWVAYIWWP